MSDLEQRRGAVGRVVLPSGDWCAGTLIAKDKVLTAASCVERYEASEVRFEPQYGIQEPGVAPTTVAVTRITQGRDAGDTEAYSDWAILRFAGVDFAKELGATYREMLPTPLPESLPVIGVFSVGYDEDLFVPGDATRGLPVTRTCDLGVGPTGERAPHSTCDVKPGAVGGPIYQMVGNQAELLGVNAGVAESPACGAGDAAADNAASGDWFAYAPRDPGALAILPDFGDGMALLARELETETPGARVRSLFADGSTFGPWRESELSFGAGSELAASVDVAGVPFVVHLDGSQLGKFDWRPAEGGWKVGLTVSLGEEVREIVVSGALGAVARLYWVSSDDGVTSLEDFGPPVGWANGHWFGSFPGTRALAATHFDGQHQLVIAGTFGLRRFYFSNESWSGPEDLGQAGVIESVALASLSATRLGIYSGSSEGQLGFQYLDASDGSVSEVEILIPNPPFRVDHFVDFDATTADADGMVRLFALGDDRNIYTVVWGMDAATYSEGWKRFYD